MTHVTCRLTAKNRDQLRNPMLGNQVWATFTFTFCTRDAMLALVLAMARCFIEADGRMELVFGMGAFFDLSS